MNDINNSARELEAKNVFYYILKHNSYLTSDESLDNLMRRIIVDTGFSIN